VADGICKIIIHGGAGRLEGKVATKEQYRIGLNEAIGPAYQTLVDKGARAAVLHAIRLLESDPIFNAGTGSKESILTLSLVPQKQVQVTKK